MGDPIAIDPDVRATPAEIAARKVSGFSVEKIDRKEFNQIIFTKDTDHVWGNENQVKVAKTASFYTDATGAPLDANDAAVTLENDDRILMAHDVEITSNLLLTPISSLRLQIGMLKGIELNFGSGVPDKIIFSPNVKSGSTIKIRGSLKFDENELSEEDRRLIVNHCRGVKIQYNNIVIYDPAQTGEIIYTDNRPSNPYLIEVNSQALDWIEDASNLTKTWFRDLNVYLGGLISNGATFDETRSRFTFPGALAYKFQVNKWVGFSRRISSDDPDIHERTDVNGISVLSTASFIISSSTVIFTSITNIKNGMRISGGDSQGIPEASSVIPGTTILKDVDTSGSVATMIDGLTLIEVTATSTAASIPVTMDNSGASGGSNQLEQDNSITKFRNKVNLNSTAPTEVTLNEDGYSAPELFSGGNTGNTITLELFKPGNEPRPDSTGIYVYQRA